MQTWNPNTPHTRGLELLNQGTSLRRIAGLQQQLITFRALASEAVAQGLFPAAPGTVATTMTPPRKPKFSEALPDHATVPMTAVDGVVCADLGYPGQTIYTNEYLPSSIGSVMNGTTDHRYARNDDVGVRTDVDGTPLPTVSTVNTGLVSDVQVEGDGNYLSDPNGNKHIGSSSFTFDTGAFPTGRHVLAVEFIVRSSGPILVTIANNVLVPGTWRTSPARMYYDSDEFESHVYRIGEAFVDNRDGATNEIWRLTPLEFVRGFSVTSGLRRLVVATDASPLATALVRTRIDSIVMRVYSTDETRQATGWLTKSGKVTFRVPSDVRRDTDTTASPAPYSKTINQTQNILLRQFFPGNVPMPSMVLSTPRIYGSAPFSADWTVRDTIGSPQTFGPTAPTKEPEPVIPTLTLFTALNNNAAVSSETQPYASTGGVFPYSGSASGERATTKNLPQGYSGSLVYVLISDTLGPRNNLTVTLASEPNSSGSTSTVELTPEDIANAPIVGQSIVSGSGTYGTDLPWRLDPTIVRWRKVRIQFPTTITFGTNGGGRIAFKAIPNEVSRSGFIQNYLIGALFPQTAGGYAPAFTIFGDAGVPSATTDGNTTYNAALANADLQVLLASAPPAPTITASLAVDGGVEMPNGNSHPVLTLTWAAGGGLPAEGFEIERYDDITGHYERIIENPTTGVFDDYEARFNTPSTYRARVVRSDGIESTWAVSAPVTPALDECRVAFSSNTDPSINSTYVDAYANDTSHTFNSRDASSVQYRRVYGRDYEVAFRSAPTGGVEFSRNVILPTSEGDERPPQDVNRALLEMTRNPNVPYICVRDSTSGRWYASVTHTSLLTTRSISHAAPVAVSALSIVEVAKSPIVSS